ncbi:MAG: ATPase, T2SS/T4P/T4SS family [Halodesulfovibrio sp.]|uniref:ATPase, T2SS/T4P/T4SS family n=1 Tax=Halodesulfovibrio sp. TaxID=1912772 RepID=UPI00359CE9C9
MRLSNISFSSLLLFSSGRFVLVGNQDFVSIEPDDMELKQDVAKLTELIAAHATEEQTFSVDLATYKYNVICIPRNHSDEVIYTVTRGEPILMVSDAPLTLNNIEFSDLLLHNGDGTYLRGLRGFGRQILPSPSEIQDEIDELRTQVNDEFEKHKRHSFRISFKGRSYRVAVFDGIATGNGHAFSLRKGVDTIPDFYELGIPNRLAEWLTDHNQQKGLILFSGPQASGKTTSAASCISKRLVKFGGHALSIEMPAEMPLSGMHGEHGTCWQCDLDGEADLPAVLQVSHRSTADIIYIGEVLGSITASELLQISLSSSRQLIFSTIHGTGVVSALDRLLTWARENVGEAATVNLSECLLGVIHQELVPTENGGWKLEIPEFLLFTDSQMGKSCRAMIKEGNLKALNDVIPQQRKILLYKGIHAL